MLKRVYSLHMWQMASKKKKPWNNNKTLWFGLTEFWKVWLEITCLKAQLSIFLGTDTKKDFAEN